MQLHLRLPVSLWERALFCEPMHEHIGDYSMIRKPEQRAGIISASNSANLEWIFGMIRKDHSNKVARRVERGVLSGTRAPRTTEHHWKIDRGRWRSSYVSLPSSNAFGWSVSSRFFLSSLSYSFPHLMANTPTTLLNKRLTAALGEMTCHTNTCLITGKVLRQRLFFGSGRERETEGKKRGHLHQWT